VRVLGFKFLVLSLLLCAPAFGVGTFDYTESTNTIEVTDGTEGAPATFNDMYTADQAGTGTVLNVAENGAAVVALDYQIRPTYDKALKVKCIVAAKTAHADYIFITGTDAWDAAQTESLDVTAGNGSYETTKRFKTITNLDCSDNAAGGGTVWADGTIAVTQDIWGVVWEHVADGQYKIDCNVDFGNDVTSTYFKSSNEEIYFSTNCIVDLFINAILASGTKEGDYGINGSMWSLALGTNTYIKGSILLYDSRIEFRDNKYLIMTGVGDVEFLNSTVCGTGTRTAAGFLFQNTGSLIYKRCNFVNLTYFVMYRAADTMENILSHYLGKGIVTSAAASAIFNNHNISSCTIDAAAEGTTENITSIDPVNNITIPKTDVSTWIKEQYTCNIHVADEDGADLETVTVQCQTFGNVVSPDAGTSFWKCVEDHTSGVWATDRDAGKWEATTAAYAALAGCTGAAQNGAWVTNIAYVASASEFSVATDSDGDITEDTIDYKKWVGTSEALLTYSPHSFTFTYGGDTHVAEDFTVDHPIVWHLEYPPQATLLSAIYDKLPTNYIMGSSDVDDHDTDIDSILEDTETTLDVYVEEIIERLKRIWAYP